MEKNEWCMRRYGAFAKKKKTAQESTHYFVWLYFPFDLTCYLSRLWSSNIRRDGCVRQRVGKGMASHFDRVFLFLQPLVASIMSECGVGLVNKYLPAMKWPIKILNSWNSMKVSNSFSFADGSSVIYEYIVFTLCTRTSYASSESYLIDCGALLKRCNVDAHLWSEWFG